MSIRSYVLRGLAAGFIAGLLAGVVALAVGEPALDGAIAIEEANAGLGTSVVSASETDSGWEWSRLQQKAGLVAGTGLAGLAVGGLFGVAGAWAVGRVRGDAWTRSLKLGAVAVGALVVLPALKYPASPPTVGDPETVTARSLLYIGVGLIGLLLAAAGWSAARALGDDDASGRPARQVGIGTVLVAVVIVLLVALPGMQSPNALPAELVWSFRLGSLATQITLYFGTAVVFGLASARAERAVRAGEPSGARAPA